MVNNLFSSTLPTSFKHLTLPLCNSRIRELSSMRIGTLVRISGQVVRTHPVHPELVRCNTRTTVTNDLFRQESQICAYVTVFAVRMDVIMTLSCFAGEWHLPVHGLPGVDQRRPSAVQILPANHLQEPRLQQPLPLPPGHTQIQVHRLPEGSCSRISVHVQTPTCTQK